MSRARAHPKREDKIVQWVGNLKPGDEFQARQIAKDLNLMPVEVGNILKLKDNLMVVGYMNGAVWKKVSA